MHSRGNSAPHSFWLSTLVAIVALVLGTAAPSLAASGPVRPTVPIHALNGPVKTSLTGFSAGNIISDAVFTDTTTMTEAQIQTFFNSKVTTCRGGVDEDGRPIVCIKDFRMNTVNRPADTYCKGYTGATGESAARIIYRVSQSCGINPQVLIVMLQKEQSLVTHTWPSAWRYDRALGQGCPDGGVACDPKFVGFFHQVYGAARQMQLYMEGRYFKWYAPGNTWNVLWHPPVEVSPGVWKDVCGSTPVYIENKATSALYYYTPYQPNAAALRAGYGFGDSCSSYGNRNFYNYFTDWFGSTQLPVSRVELQPINTSGHVLAVDGGGRLLAYPFKSGRWGSPVQVGDGFEGRQIHGIGDLNGDGNRDVIAVRPDKSLDFVSGNGSSFGAVWRLPGDLGGARLSSAGGDFDGDGIPDLFTATADGALLLWRGTDKGLLRQGKSVGVGWQNMNLMAGGGDLSGDGVPDLLGRDGNGTLWLYSGDGHGGWSKSTSLGFGWDMMASIIAPGDFDGDGVADLLAIDWAGQMWVYPGVGGGAFRRGPVVGTGWNTIATVSAPGASVQHPRAPRPGIGDLTGTGGPGIVGLTPDGALNMYAWAGSGAMSSAKLVSTAWSGQRRTIPMGDFDGDGARDIGSIDSSGRFLLWSGNGVGGYKASRVIGAGWDPKQLIIGAVDYDGDGNTDILVRNAAGDLMLYRGNGKGGWVSNFGTWVNSGWQINSIAFYAGDFDGDGAGDLIARRAADGNLWLYRLDGRGGWKAASVVGTGWSNVTTMFSPGDLNSDGHTDVLARRSDGVLMLYPGDGSGGWLGVSYLGTGWNMYSDLG